jgi:hypothetical protein
MKMRPLASLLRSFSRNTRFAALLGKTLARPSYTESYADIFGMGGEDKKTQFPFLILIPNLSRSQLVTQFNNAQHLPRDG